MKGFLYYLNFIIYSFMNYERLFMLTEVQLLQKTSLLK